LKRSLKILLVGGGAVAAVFVVAATLLPFVVDAEHLRPQVETRLQAALGRRIWLGPVRLSLWSGLAIRAAGFRVGEPLVGPASGVLVAEAGATSVHVAILPLLRRDVQVRSIAAEDLTVSRDGKPVVSELSVSSRLRVSPEGAVEAKGHASGSLSAISTAPRFRTTFAATLVRGTLEIGTLDATVGPLRLVAHGRVSGALSETPRLALAGSAKLLRSSLDGRCDVLWSASGPKASLEATSPLLDADEIVTAVAQLAGPASASRSAFALIPEAHAEEGLRGAAGPALLRSMELEGTIRADRCRYRGLEMTDLSMRLSIARGVAEIREIALALYGGTARGTLTARPFDPSLPFSLEEAAAGIAIGPLVAALAPAQAGTVEGTASFELDLNGRASGPSILPSISGEGTVAIVDGRLATFGALGQVTKTLEMAGASGLPRDGTPFDHLSAHLDIVHGTAATKDLEFRSRDIDGDGKGTVGPGGALSLDILASFSKAVSGDLVARTPALSIRQGANGRLSVPLKLRGTIREPHIQLDLDRVIQEGVLNRLQ
jgi:uncharacterized protein involved in outer membrane biogenesis